MRFCIWLRTPVARALSFWKTALPGRLLERLRKWYEKQQNEGAWILKTMPRLGESTIFKFWVFWETNDFGSYVGAHFGDVGSLNRRNRFSGICSICSTLGGFSVPKPEPKIYEQFVLGVNLFTGGWVVLIKIVLFWSLFLKRFWSDFGVPLGASLWSKMEKSSVARTACREVAKIISKKKRFWWGLNFEN